MQERTNKAACNQPARTNAPKLSEEQAIELRRRYLEGETVSDLAFEYRVAPSSVSRVIHEAARRGIRTRVVVTVPTAYAARLDAIAEKAGFSRSRMAEAALTVGLFKLEESLE